MVDQSSIFATMRKIALWHLLLCFFISCSRPFAHSDNAYLQPYHFLSNELAAFDSAGYGFSRIILHDAQPNDTLPFYLKDMRAQITPFLVEDLQPKKFQKRFNETSFADATMGTITFCYTPKKANSPISRADIFVNPQTSSIDKIFLSLHRQSKDTLIQQKLLWKKDHYYMLYSTFTLNNTDSSSVEKIIWYKPTL